MVSITRARSSRHRNYEEPDQMIRASVFRRGSVRYSRECYKPVTVWPSVSPNGAIILHWTTLSLFESTLRWVRMSFAGATSDVAIILLAAGSGSRFGAKDESKLLAEFNGVPLVRRSAIRASQSLADSVTAVVGYRASDIVATLADLPINYAFNPGYDRGMSGSLIAGIRAPKAQSAAGVLVMLADMPSITTEDLNSLIATFEASSGQSIVIATCHGELGNPVILPSKLYSSIMDLEGDVGARKLIAGSGLAIIEVEVGGAALHDVDTVEALLAAGGNLARV